jgi:endonuclease/exonuclease/phosphatase family metal-dependent hydrolase
VLGLEEGVAVPHIQKIARGLNRHLATFPSPIAWPGHVLSRFPVMESRVFSHTALSEEVLPFSRTAGATLLEIDAKSRFWFVVLHLHPGILELWNVEADIIRTRLVELMSVTKNAIVVGDLNCEIEEKLHHSLKEMQFVNAMESVGGLKKLFIELNTLSPLFGYVWRSSVTKKRCP